MDIQYDPSGDDSSCDQVYDVVNSPSAAMISIMIVSMICTVASTVKTFMQSREPSPPAPYDRFETQGEELLDLRMPP